MSNEKKVIAVLGSTGAQGGSVVNYLLNDSDRTFTVRAITRKVDSAAGDELRTRGAEVVFANLEDVESLKTAFTGAYGVFGVTNFWELFAVHDTHQAMTQAHETQQGKNIVDAAKAANVMHLVWSTLDHTHVGCPHMESKYDVDEYLKTKDVPRTSLYTSLYYENVTEFGFLKKEEAGEGFILKFPMTSDHPFPSYTVGETGGWVLTAFKEPAVWIGKDMHAIGENNTPEDIGAVLGRVSGKPVKVEKVTTEQFLTDEFRLAVSDELWQNMKIFLDNACKRDVELSKQGFAKGSNYETFARQDPKLKALMGY